MKVFFKTRTDARNAKFGSLKDCGTNAPTGKRWARELNIKVKAK